ncbi:MAG: hypothetical protein JWN75_1052 [Candidatus Saccharibacteria bacterium]|nr:hypothetical protein [Candidatus Saccharibacteria bacterium]
MMIALVVVLAIQPRRTLHSRFELQRRGERAVLRREMLLGDVLTLRRFVTMVLVIGLAGLGVTIWHGWGVVATFVVVFTVFHFSRTSIARKRANHIYVGYELKLLNFVEKFPLVGRLLGAGRMLPDDPHLESTEQLADLVQSASYVLTADQQQIIINSLDWNTIPVARVMTARADIVSVKHSELLGPLVLHDLHESHHTVFPVIKKDLDHIIGIVDISEMLQVDKIKSSHTAEKVMNAEVETVAPDIFLPDALELLLSAHQPFLIVVDDDKITVGLVTIRDVLGELLGKNRGEVVK